MPSLSKNLNKINKKYKNGRKYIQDLFEWINLSSHLKFVQKSFFVFDCSLIWIFIDQTWTNKERVKIYIRDNAEIWGDKLECITRFSGVDN